MPALVVGCDSNPHESFIQGTWVYSAPSVGGVTPQSSVHTRWTFDDGAVDATSCCADRPGFSGRYRVVEDEGDTLVLEIFDVEGAAPDEAETEDESSGYRVSLKLNREADTLYVEGTGPFVRE